MKAVSPLPAFGEYFSVYFTQLFPAIAAMLHRERTVLAANIYLFRFDNHLSPHFINNNLDSFSRSIADVSGKSIPEARRLFTYGVRDAARNYFASGWDNIPQFVSANATALRHLQTQNTKLAVLAESLQNAPSLPEVDPVLLNSLLENKLPVMVMVYADYCSVCKAVKPFFEDAAREMEGRALFVGLNGARSPEFKDEYRITSYPSILRFNGPSDVMHFPKHHFDMNCGNFVSFAEGDDSQYHVDIDDPDSSTECLYHGNDEVITRRSRAYMWETMLKRQGIDELDALITERNEVLHSKIDMAIQCGGSSCDVLPLRSNDVRKGDPPPLCVLLGGGMGAGKTTAVGLIARTPFWKAHGAGVVVVEADAFKMTDPLFQVLQSVTPLASRIVHKDSIVAAEELFLKAVNTRRDVIFDGTLSWYEYARQTECMLHDTDYTYKRGPGYVENTDGTVMELYWERDQKRETPVDPYRIELVGVTAEAEICVMRGIVRRICTGRGVAVPDQLKSHALFSQHFESYIDLFDSIYLFDTSLDSDAVKDKNSYADQLVAIKPGLLFENPDAFEGVRQRSKGGVSVLHSDGYTRFIKKKFLNTAANCIEDLYSETKMKTVLS